MVMADSDSEQGGSPATAADAVREQAARLVTEVTEDTGELQTPRQRRRLAAALETTARTAGRGMRATGRGMRTARRGVRGRTGWLAAQVVAMAPRLRVNGTSGRAAGAVSRAPARPDRRRADRGRVASVGRGRRGGRGVGGTAGPARLSRRGGHGNAGPGRDRDQAGGRAARGIRDARPRQHEGADERLRGGVGAPPRRVHGSRRAAAGGGVPAGATVLRWRLAARRLQERVLTRPAVHRRRRRSGTQPQGDPPPRPRSPPRPAPPRPIGE